MRCGAHDAYDARAQCVFMRSGNARQRIRFFGGALLAKGGTIPFQRSCHTGRPGGPAQSSCLRCLLQTSVLGSADGWAQPGSVSAQRRELCSSSVFMR